MHIQDDVLYESVLNLITLLTEYYSVSKVKVKLIPEIILILFSHTRTVGHINDKWSNTARQFQETSYISSRFPGIKKNPIDIQDFQKC